MSQCKHQSPPDLSYSGAIADAEMRLRRGEKQGQCEMCGKWIWSYLFNTRTDFIEAFEWGREVQREIRKIEREERKGQAK